MRQKNPQIKLSRDLIKTSLVSARPPDNGSGPDFIYLIRCAGEFIANRCSPPASEDLYSFVGNLQGAVLSPADRGGTG